MNKHIIIACMVALLVAVMCVPCSAVQVEEYSYNGVTLPKLPETDGEYCRMYVHGNGSYYIWLTSIPGTGSKTTDLVLTGTSGGIYKLVDGQWQEFTMMAMNLTLHWSNYDVLTADGALTFAGSDIVVTLVEKAVEFGDFSDPLRAMAEQISVSTLVGLLAFIVTSIIALPFLWWASRKSVRACMTAFRKGRVKV